MPFEKNRAISTVFGIVFCSAVIVDQSTGLNSPLPYTF